MLCVGWRITRRYGGKLQTVIEDLNLANAVIRSHYRKGFLKQYVRDRFLLRTETATNNISTDYGIGKAVENIPSPLFARIRNMLASTGKAQGEDVADSKSGQGFVT